MVKRAIELRTLPFYLVIAFIFTFLSCSLQYYNVKDEDGSRETKINGNRERIRANLIRKFETTRKTAYNSQQIEFEFAGSKIFDNKENSALTITYSTISQYNGPAVTGILWLLSLGILPAIGDSASIASFEISDIKTGKIIRDYKYRTDGWFINSWAAIPFAFTIPLIKKSFTQEYGINFSEYPQALVMERFQNDILKDFEKNPEFYNELLRTSQQPMEEVNK
ncbi:hypothetical protein LPTSP3_g01040 [Leptospira kobayashii]|uniref:Lipoprotein n=1 Tax=Leptospira kobayashii TaxID=1917830 RepID=A0ABM7UQX9_9LEPT|nr:hypothetical protein [Leptospira kobayashii]BDA77174.1 hypothetical protein LPTSP3_g01040 [Leptospira kobayashii]